jgi:cysteine desulfurase/selenocysteine lyase
MMHAAPVRAQSGNRAERRQTSRGLDLERIRADFPALHQTVNDHPLVYLDNAATTLKPQAVIDAVVSVYVKDAGNVHRAVHALSARATARYEGARAKLQRFWGASDSREVVFVRGATEAINLVAQAYARPRLGPGDEVLITALEHHSNLVPWQLVCEQTGARLQVARIDDRGELDVEHFRSLLSRRTRMVAVAHASNALGTVLPVKQLVRLAHEHGARVLVDGAQAAPHLAIDIQDLDCDFYAMSGHKLYGPTGIGVLYGKRALLETMPPYQGGGDMIQSVTFGHSVYQDPPHRFEAGTPNIAGAVGLGAAIDYLRNLDWPQVVEHESDLLAYGTRRLEAMPGVRLIGTAAHKIGVLSFVVDGVHPHDLATVADMYGVAIRAGHHCAQPVMDRFGVAATGRASFGIYNTRDDVDALADAVERAQEIFDGCQSCRNCTTS